MSAERLIGPEQCGGNVRYDVDGNFVERYACEVHLFSGGVCGWQRAMFEERRAGRRD